MIRFSALFLMAFFLSAYAASPCAAAATDAKEIARINNCSPKKIEVFKQSIGPNAQTVYKVECNVPKTSGESSSTSADAMLIQCSGSLCEMMRPLMKDGK